MTDYDMPSCPSWGGTAKFVLSFLNNSPPAILTQQAAGARKWRRRLWMAFAARRRLGADARWLAIAAAKRRRETFL
jgi:hypothetical protein